MAQRLPSFRCRWTASRGGGSLPVGPWSISSGGARRGRQWAPRGAHRASRRAGGRIVKRATAWGGRAQRAERGAGGRHGAARADADANGLHRGQRGTAPPGWPSTPALSPSTRLSAGAEPHRHQPDRDGCAPEQRCGHVVRRRRGGHVRVRRCRRRGGGGRLLEQGGERSNVAPALPSPATSGKVVGVTRLSALTGRRRATCCGLGLDHERDVSLIPRPAGSRDARRHRRGAIDGPGAAAPDARCRGLGFHELGQSLVHGPLDTRQRRDEMLRPRARAGGSRRPARSTPSPKPRTASDRHPVGALRSLQAGTRTEDQRAIEEATTLCALFERTCV